VPGTRGEKTNEREGLILRKGLKGVLGDYVSMGKPLLREKTIRKKALGKVDEERCTRNGSREEAVYFSLVANLRGKAGVRLCGALRGEEPRRGGVGVQGGERGERGGGSLQGEREIQYTVLFAKRKNG